MSNMNDIADNAEKIANNTDDMFDMQVQIDTNAIDIQINNERIRKKHPTTFAPGTTFTPGTETTVTFGSTTELGPICQRHLRCSPIFTTTEGFTTEPTTTVASSTAPTTTVASSTVASSTVPASTSAFSTDSISDSVPTSPVSTSGSTPRQTTLEFGMTVSTEGIATTATPGFTPYKPETESTNGFTEFTTKPTIGSTTELVTLCKAHFGFSCPPFSTPTFETSEGTTPTIETTGGTGFTSGGTDY